MTERAHCQVAQVAFFTSHVSGWSHRIRAIFPSFHLCVWVCESYIVHYLNGTGLRCAPPTCVVHCRALCTMVHKGDLCQWEVINSVCDGAEYTVVSLALCVCVNTLMAELFDLCICVCMSQSTIRLFWARGLYSGGCRRCLNAQAFSFHYGVLWKPILLSCDKTNRMIPKFKTVSLQSTLFKKQTLLWLCSFTAHFLAHYFSCIIDVSLLLKASPELKACYSLLLLLEQLLYGTKAHMTTMSSIPFFREHSEAPYHQGDMDLKNRVTLHHRSETKGT